MDSLQFQKLELADTRPRCSGCQSVIEGTYYHLAGKPICPTCAEITRSAQQRPATNDVLRGLLYGSGAAVACSIGYAVITIMTDMQFALIAILVGYLVGRAMRIGSRGLGGRRCQILAVVLTYLAITISYVPLVIKAVKDQQTKTETVKTVPQAPVKVTAAGLVLALAVVSAISIASPFFGLANGFSGIIGAIIIFVGLAQAWKQTKRDERLLMGPYESAEGQAVG